MDAKPYAILILAAGASKRLGSPKQLVPYQGDTLLYRTIKASTVVAKAEVYVVLGSEVDSVMPAIPKHVTVLYHEGWKEGMGSTIAFAIRSIAGLGHRAAIVSVCDQPHLTADVFVDLIQQYENHKLSVVSCRYTHGSGPPTLFDATLFSELAMLSGDIGAKTVVQNAGSDPLCMIPFPLGYIDIDTPEDVSLLLHKK